MRELAARHGLVVEPGRNVIEVRSDGMHKGHAVETLVREQSAGGFLFAGDDLGDIEAFEAVAALREQGLPTLLVCSPRPTSSPPWCRSPTSSSTVPTACSTCCAS